jgi:hypothetical protein
VLPFISKAVIDVGTESIINNYNTDDSTQCGSNAYTKEYERVWINNNTGETIYKRTFEQYQEMINNGHEFEDIDENGLDLEKKKRKVVA